MTIAVALAGFGPLVPQRPQRLTEFLLAHGLHGFQHSPAQQVLNVLAQMDHIRLTRGIL